ncbi:hypothetical protein MTR67_010807 [Solanum verrucosum]|uniref:RING-type E3 ubiquitin transferase n=1 Tax=Solanum verrucosum TaxID=315347 RepID=A0AAF0TEI7_SOLVR|nr:hypothetical protein MTR67_010807 [Solanum verrucosum]
MNTRRRSFREQPRPRPRPQPQPQPPPASMARFHALRDALSQAEQHERSRIPRQQNMREVVPTAEPTATNWEPIIRTTSTVPPPATKASIEKLPDVEIVQEEEEQMSECAICLVEFQVKETAKEMPCKHCYHSNCINRWSSYIQYEAGPSPPAAQASVEALPIVKIIEEESECAICLSEFQVGEKAKEMSCKHRYHSNCINQWLEIHRSCPVCRYKMPAAVVTAGRRPTLRESIRRVGSSINELDEEQTDIYIESILGCVFYSVYFGLLYMLSS